jgi:hypothetical protein
VGAAGQDTSVLTTGRLESSGIASIHRSSFIIPPVSHNSIRLRSISSSLRLNDYGSKTNDSHNSFLSLNLFTVDLNTAQDI